MLWNHGVHAEKLLKSTILGLPPQTSRIGNQPPQIGRYRGRGEENLDCSRRAFVLLPQSLPIILLRARA